MSRLRSCLYISSVTRFKMNSHLDVTRSLSTNTSNHYEVLDVSRGSSQSEIKEAYYELSKQYHPDRNPGDDDASDKFRKITEAYDVLSNVDAKREYDQTLAFNDAKSSPYTANYKEGMASPIFREINRKTGQSIDSDDYTQFYKNRQFRLGRKEHSTTKFGSPNVDPVMENAVNPFNIFVEVQSPPIVKKMYKPLSQSEWKDPAKNLPNDGWTFDGTSTPIAIASIVILLITIYQLLERGKQSKYYNSPKASIEDR